ncbi:NAD-dependent epimerase/dehydratase family protein [Jannaschia sp. R86511]|uniref:NAD-dependent epimerase/dehydratase family protein n=1 Tax=Jannaschia sp. R86511 TaxID=3093853 RepID=UPI0036D3ABB4
MSPLRVVVLGARGFLGSAVVRAGRKNPYVGDVRAVCRPGSSPNGVVADVRDPEQVAAVVAGADVVVNAAHVIGTGAATEVNRIGPAVVARAAAIAGAKCIELGTAAVYGRGPLRGGAEGRVAVAPGSDLSVSRAAGEQEAMRAGATVLRPMIVVGPGDRWAVPGAAAAAASLSRVPRASVGVVDVDDLARLTLSVAVMDDVPPLLHVSRREPVPLARLLDDAGYRPPPDTEAHGQVAAMLDTDRWVDSRHVWQVVGWEPEGPVISEAARRWYGTPPAGAARTMV